MPPTVLSIGANASVSREKRGRGERENGRRTTDEKFLSPLSPLRSELEGKTDFGRCFLPVGRENVDCLSSG